MFSICKEIHPPTGVEMVSYCYFFDRREKNLVVAGANSIKAYRFVPDIYDTSADETKAPKMRMECMGEYRFNGNIVSMESMSLSLARDALLLAFRDAKLSVVEYDPETHDLRTISLHYFETDDFKGGWDLRPTCKLRVDPDGRCAALLVYSRHLVVIPFLKRDSIFEEQYMDASDIKPNIASLNRIPALRSYTIDLKDVDDGVENIVDFKFLHGYYEPTIVFVYEPVQTYVGRLTVRQDTCSLVAVSLNFTQKVHPSIWHVSQLPFDCCQVLAVPKPIGGVLVMAQNSLIYLNQSVPSYAVALNYVAPKTSAFPMKVQEDVILTLDCTQADFLAPDQVIFSLKGGELYVLTLLCDAVRNVRGFHFEKSASSVLTTCLIVCDKDYIFLGSRLGNSLLLRLTEKGIARVAVEQTGVSNGNDVEVQDLTEDDDDDDIVKLKKSRKALDDEEAEVYGSEKKTHFTLKTYLLEVCDSILNVGPCGNMTLGEPSFLSDDFIALEDPDLELVTTSGYGKNGALCILERSIRPQVVTTITLHGLTDLWTLHSAPGQENHEIIVVSHENRSIILHADEDINQLTDSGFLTQMSTLFVCNLGNSKYIAQVYKDGVRLLRGTVEIQRENLQLNSEITFATATDPYLCVLTEDGYVVLLTLEGEQLLVTSTQLHKKSKVTAISCYSDSSGLFTTKSPGSDNPEEQIMQLAKVKKEMRDEDELLYGIPDASDSNFKKQLTANTSRWWRRNRHKYQSTTPSNWLAVCRENGSLEILTLPDLQVRMSVFDFSSTPRVLGHTTQRQDSDEVDPNLPIVHELLLVGLGYLSRRPIIFARIGDDLFIYEGYPYYEDTYEDVLKLRFAQIKHHLILRDRRSARGRGGSTLPGLKRHFRHFSSLAGYSGVFVCGPYPHWIFLSTSGHMWFHPMGIDSRIIAFAPFNNPNCPFGGFIYCNVDYEFRICMLAKHLSYDSPWPMRKVPLKHTPHFVVYHQETKTYVVALSVGEPSAKICRVAGEEKEFIDEPKDERFPLPVRDNFSLHIFSPATWEVVPNAELEMEPFENILCLKVVSLSYEGARSGLRGYLAVGTNYSYGEDTTSRGRLMVLDVIEVVPEPGQPLTKNKFKLLYQKEHKGPITAIDSVVGFLCATVGQKLYLWQLKDNDLIGIAFIDTQIYIHQMITVKNLIYIADVYKSVQLLRFQETHRTLAVVSRDFRPLIVYGISFLIDNTQLGLVATDQDRNVHVYMFQPQARESFGGQRLVRKADFHFGQQILSFARVRCKVLDPSTTKRNSIAIEKRHVTFFCTLDGGLGFLLPVTERTYRRLLMLQSVLSNMLQHRGGLNPKTYRQVNTTDRTLGNPMKGIIDGELVWEFINLSWKERCDVSKKIGSKIDDIVEDLMEIDRISAHF